MNNTVPDPHEDGMLWENLLVQARDRSGPSARSTGLSMQIIDCEEVQPTMKKEGLDLEE